MNNIWENKERIRLIMKINIYSLMIIFLLFITCFAIGSEENNMEKHHALNQKQQCIIPIAAFTAEGDINRLKPALNQGLEAGLTVNEIKEVLVHLYAYTGFPCSLNALSAFMEVVDERQAKGIKDAMGKEASPVPPDLDRDEYGAKVRAKLAGLDKVPPPAKWQLFSPVIDTFLKEHLFADLFIRDVISHQDRELTTIAALANMTGTAGQLRFHLGAAMNTGLTEAQMKDFISIFATRIDKKKAEDADEILNTVLKGRK
jgi:4-carboxymuconolactone decarboxylase